MTPALPICYFSAIRSRPCLPLILSPIQRLFKHAFAMYSAKPQFCAGCYASRSALVTVARMHQPSHRRNSLARAAAKGIRMPSETLTTAPLLLRPREAAKMLAVSERTLWALTAPRGPIPAAKIFRAVRYRLADLEAFAAQAAQENGRR